MSEMGRQFGKKPFSEIPVDAPTDKGASWRLPFFSPENTI